jgi:hypothetical protein
MVPEDRKTGEHKNPGAETGAGVFSIEVNDWDPDAPTEVVEPPPEGFGDIKDRSRRHCVEDPRSGESREVANFEELKAYRKRGWKWVLRSDDLLEMMHIQAWYFQVRHFPRSLGSD